MKHYEGERIAAAVLFSLFQTIIWTTITAVITATSMIQDGAEYNPQS